MPTHASKTVTKKWRGGVEIENVSPLMRHISLSMEMSRLTRDGTAEPVSRDQILRRERGQEKKTFSLFS